MVMRELEGFAFGLADGIICFLAIIIGVLAATGSAKLVIIAAIVGGIADAFGNSIGFYISQKMEKGVQTHDRKMKKTNFVHSEKEVIMNGVFSFISTVLVLVMVIAPFFFLDMWEAATVSTAISILMLAGIGYYTAGLSGESKLKTALTFVFLGMLGAFASWLVGSWLKTAFA